MSLFNGFMGNATETNKEEVKKELSRLLMTGEEIGASYKLVRDLIVFTNKRLVLVDKQGVTGKKIEYLSLPYKSITHFSVETAGTFDLDAELKIYVSGRSTPIAKQFRKDDSIFDIQKTLSELVI
ncbi:PH domain-containing protein [Priestia endophytica]|uniref:PH domain-containing protein n=1 Tax=Priestia endophytica DSM 13796 TaxID=1121089 RepID=A0A1I6BYZ2_9BACI|nr:PH domain-containing protein [Priestia endophytica]KYG33201.1 helicase [Priestia endophytica]SFQ86075.1 PH domain-containing protein [Priestia endophytica DSM 13796]